MIKNCVICGEEFEIFLKPNKSRSSSFLRVSHRPSNAKTCSKKCSKIHTENLRKEYSYKNKKY